jgi:hypothetical protein
MKWKTESIKRATTLLYLIATRPTRLRHLTSGEKETTWSVSWGQDRSSTVLIYPGPHVLDFYCVRSTAYFQPHHLNSDWIPRCYFTHNLTMVIWYFDKFNIIKFQISNSNKLKVKKQINKWCYGWDPLKIISFNNINIQLNIKL